MTDELQADQHPPGRADDDTAPDGAAPTTDDAIDAPSIGAPLPSTLDHFTGVTPGNVEHAEAVEQSGQSPDSAARTAESE